MSVGDRVYWHSPGEHAVGEIVRVEGEPPTHVWITWIRQGQRSRPQRLRLPSPWLHLEDEDEYHMPSL